jgi:hypothetical protein
VGAALTQIGARFVDAAGVLASKPPARLFFPFDGHLDQDGNRYVPEALRTASLSGWARRSGAALR